MDTQADAARPDTGGMEKEEGNADVISRADESSDAIDKLGSSSIDDDGGQPAKDINDSPVIV